jgi:CcmD family protein
MLKRCVAIVLLCGGLAGMAAPVFAQQSAGQERVTERDQQEGFVPVDQLPPQDQLPAAPLLIAAYVFVLLALFGYVFSVAKRLNAVQREVQRLEGDIHRSGRG